METTAQTTQIAPPSNDLALAEAFVGKLVGQTSSTFAIMCAALGDKYGLFKDLAAHGAHTPKEIAECCGVAERYVREWASCLACDGYLVHDAKKDTFALAPGTAPVLAEEGGPFFFGGFFEMMAGLMQIYKPVAQAFKDGKGVDHKHYGEDIWKAELRQTDMWHENLLVQQWVPAVPAFEAKLKAGARVADIGAGSGKALVRLAQAFPKSTFVGFDIDHDSVERARALAKKEKVADRVSFEVRDLTKGIPKGFDAVTAFDVVHDTADPLGVFKHVRQALNPGGLFVLLEINGAETLEGNAGPMGTVFYGVSTFFCMSIAIGRGGEGLGTAGLHKGMVRQYAKAAGFAGVRDIDINNPFNTLFEVSA